MRSIHRYVCRAANFITVREMSPKHRKINFQDVPAHGMKAYEEM